MSKLTLSVDSEIAEQAKTYAREHSTSVSELVESYLSALSSFPKPPDTPMVKHLRGLLSAGSRDNYRDYLSNKYL